MLYVAYWTLAEASYNLKDYTAADTEIKRALEVRRAIPTRTLFERRDESGAAMLAAMIITGPTFATERSTARR